MHVHARYDPAVPYLGSTGGLNGVFPGLPTLAEEWRGINGCVGPTEVLSVGPVLREEDADCADGTGVVLVTIEAHEHRWPGYHNSVIPRSTFDTTREIWEFFAAHPRP
jgi:polyhydroxybutyrate depolymerase